MPPRSRVPALVAAMALGAIGAPMHAQPSPNPAPPAPANRLAASNSPYLLQHAHNPVDWYPWGPEAFAEARRRGVPIFLSVGYSTCYWCHVMERESFESEEIAGVMNDLFVCVKVDREERPDVDDIYMAAVQLITQRGGWPMSVWLTPPGARGEDDPGLEPFYAGTYFPAEPRGGMAAFPDVLRALSDAWMNQRDQVLDQAARVTQAVRENIARDHPPAPVGRAETVKALTALLQLYDREHAGFGRAPKFPQPVYLAHLLEMAPTIDDPAVASLLRRAFRHTLDRMALGGMYDQIGGGFHRYSVDEKWLVPHFEKMLYDNGQLASIYARAYAQWQDPFDAEILRETLDYVLRELTHELGGFYSAQDAEVNHREGQNYLWTTEQLHAALGEDGATFAARVYGVDRGPNFRDPHHPHDPPVNILFLSARPDELAAELNMDPRAFAERLQAVNKALYAARMKRDQPALDDKIIAAWNGLMITGMADGAAALGDLTYLDAAEKAAAFVLDHMRDEQGRLLRVWRRGERGEPAFLEDYAAMAQGLLAIHRARLAHGRAPAGHLTQAAKLIEAADEMFGEDSGPRAGAMYDTREGAGDLIVRAFSTYDGAIPAGPSMMAYALLDLAELSGDDSPRDRAVSLLRALSHYINEAPVATINATRALQRLLTTAPEVAASLAHGFEPEDSDTVVLDESPVQVFAPGERIRVPASAAAELPVELRIVDGFHITARNPGLAGLIPLDVRIGGGDGVRATVEYPDGEPYRGGAVPPEDRDSLRVHTGVLRLDVKLKQTGKPWTGEPRVLITYQVCSDDACFQPITVELDVEIVPE